MIGVGGGGGVIVDERERKGRREGPSDLHVINAVLILWSSTDVNFDDGV